MISMIKNILIVLIAIIFASCSQVMTRIESGKVYKLDMLIQSGNYFGYGVLVLPKLNSYTLELSTEKKIDWISFRTCSRTITVEDPRVGISRKQFKLTYTPNEVELKENFCPAYIVALSEAGMQSMGLIDFEDSRVSLPAVSVCGSLTESTNGASICQEKIGSIEKIIFKVDTIVSPDIDCELENTSGMEYRYRVKKGVCTYIFVEKNKPNRMHRHVTIGYESEQVRR